MVVRPTVRHTPHTVHPLLPRWNAAVRRGGRPDCLRGTSRPPSAQTHRILIRYPHFLLLVVSPIPRWQCEAWRGAWACCGATMAVDCYLRFPQ